jgi:hypothetical protein
MTPPQKKIFAQKTLPQSQAHTMGDFKVGFNIGV